MNITYCQLKEWIETLSEEQKKATVTVLAEGEYYPVSELLFTDEKYCDQLDHNHPVLELEL